MACRGSHYLGSRRIFQTFNPLNAEINPICHLLALLGAHHILHVSRIRVKYILSFESTVGILLPNFESGNFVMDWRRVTETSDLVTTPCYC